MSSIKKIIFISFVFLLFIASISASALEISYPRLPGVLAPQDFTSQDDALPLYIKYVVTLIMWLGGILAFGALVYGGVLYLIATGKPESIIRAREQIFGGFFGLLLILSSFIILNTLNPRLTVLEMPKIEEIKKNQKEVPVAAELPENKSLLSVELPFGRLIESKIFETYISDLPDNTSASAVIPNAGSNPASASQQQKKPRITEIKENAQTTLDLVKKISENGKTLDEKSKQCDCGQAFCPCPLNPFDPGYLATNPLAIASLQSVVGPDNLSQALGTTANLNSLTEAPPGFGSNFISARNFSDVMAGLENIAGNASNPAEAFLSAGELADFAATQNMADFPNFFDSLGNYVEATDLGLDGFSDYLSSAGQITSSAFGSNPGGIFRGLDDMLTNGLNTKQGLNGLAGGVNLTGIGNYATNMFRSAKGGNYGGIINDAFGMLQNSNIPNLPDFTNVSGTGINLVNIGNGAGVIAEAASGGDYGSIINGAFGMLRTSGIPGMPDFTNVSGTGINLVNIGNGAGVLAEAASGGNYGNVINGAFGMLRNSGIPNLPDFTNVSGTGINLVNIGNGAGSIADAARGGNIGDIINRTFGMLRTSGIPNLPDFTNVSGTGINLVNIGNGAGSIAEAANSGNYGNIINGTFSMLRTSGIPNLPNFNNIGGNGISLPNIENSLANIMQNYQDPSAVFNSVSNIISEANGPILRAGNRTVDNYINQIIQSQGDINIITKTIQLISDTVNGPDLSRLGNTNLGLNEIGNSVSGIIQGSKDLDFGKVFQSANGFTNPLGFNLEQIGLPGGNTFNLTNIGASITGVLNTGQGRDFRGIFQAANGFTSPFGVNLGEINIGSRNLNLMNFGSSVTGIINGAGGKDFGGLFQSMGGITDQLGFDLNKVKVGDRFLNFGELGNSLTGIINGAGGKDFGGLFQSMGGITEPLGVNLNNISLGGGRVLNFGELGNSLAGMMGAAQDKDFGSILIWSNDITTPLGLDMSKYGIKGFNVLELASSFDSVMQNPLNFGFTYGDFAIDGHFIMGFKDMGFKYDLFGNVGLGPMSVNLPDVFSVFTRDFPTVSNLFEALGDLGSIAKIIDNPYDFASAMTSVGGLSQKLVGKDIIQQALQKMGAIGAVMQLLATTVKDCDCDVCRQQRSDLEKAQNNSLDELLPKIKQEKEKTLTYIEDLKKELNRLQRTADFARNCPAFNNLKNSYLGYLNEKDKLKSQGGINTISKFWDDINISYKDKKGEIVEDWATLICNIGGNMLSTFNDYSDIFSRFGSEYETKQQNKENPQDEKEIDISQPTACALEMPFGEIEDRTQRLGNLIIRRLEELVKLDEEMAKVIDEMHVLVSKCTSQQPMCSCICTDIGEGICVGVACPHGEISQQLEKIKEVQKKFEHLINDPVDKENKEKSGIIALIDQPQQGAGATASSKQQKSPVAVLLEDLDNEIRYPMQLCEPTKNHDRKLTTCKQSISSFDSKGNPIEVCCEKEAPYQKCLEKCYLEDGQKKYKDCLDKCLDQESKSDNKNSEEISACRHRLNFYCCAPAK